MHIKTPLVLCLGLALAGCQSGLDKTIGDMAFSPLRPPRTSTPPGTIVWIKSTNPTVIQIVCPVADALGPGAKTVPSATLTENWQSKTQGSLNLEASYRDQINAKLGAKSVRDVSMDLSNAAVIEMPVSEVYRAVAGHASQAYCVSAVKDFAASHRTLSMIYSVLKADVLYTIKYDNSVSADAQAKITKDIAPTLTVSVDNVGQNTIKGTGLFWGVTDDEQLVKAFLGPPPPHALLAETAAGIKSLQAFEPAKPDKAVRLIPAGQVQVIEAAAGQ